ncbi:MULTISPECIES: hypothetical protein [unclassified Mesorhizobium]|uniref:hypothetical protein n=1 Tax=unclassified Mesorhizobium TaxID=325217 RepID=UPI003335B637
MRAHSYRQVTSAGTLAELARKEIKGRSNPQQITLFKAVGSGLADLFAAKLVYCSL